MSTTPLWTRRFQARTLLLQQELRQLPPRAPRLPPLLQPPVRTLTASSPASRAPTRAASRMNSQRSSKGSAGKGSSGQIQGWVHVSTFSFHTRLCLLFLHKCIQTKHGCTYQSKTVCVYSVQMRLHLFTAASSVKLKGVLCPQDICRS